MPTLSTNIEKVYQKGFTPLLQAMVSKLRPLVTVKSFPNAKEFYMNQIGQTSVSEVSDLTAATILSSTTTARRQIKKKNYYYHELITDDQVNNMSFDPKADLVTNIMRAFAVKIDEVIVAAATATALTGVDGGTSTVFDTANQTIVHGSSGAGYQKILDGVEIYLANDFVGDRLSWIVGPKQVNELLNVSQITNRDYMKLQPTEIMSPMMNGYLFTINVGINVDVFVSTALAVTSQVRSTLLFPKGGIGFGIGLEPNAKFVTRGDLNSQDQISIGAIFGASRLDEQQVVVIECDES